MWIDLVLFIAFLIGIFTIFYTWNYNYWKKRGLPYEKPIFPFGSLKDVILFKKTFGDLLDEWYYKYKDYKYFGIYFGRNPVLYIRDAQLAKDVLGKNFHYFQDNNARISEKADPILGNNPFILKGLRWKTTRAHLTPGFTTLKLKQMFSNMMPVSDRLTTFIQQHIDSNKNTIKALDISSNFATEVFTLAALNIKSDAFDNPQNPFKTIAGNLLTGSPLKLFITWMLMTLDPTLAVLLRIRILSKEAETYFKNAISDVLAYREKNNLVINDFCNHLNNIHLKNPKDFTRDDVVSNMITIFLDGVETSSQVFRILLREVAAHPDVFKKLRNEIDTIKNKYNDEITFDGLQEMTYLDSCLFETLRIYSALLAAVRVCTQPFEFPPAKEGEPSLKIQPGTPVVLPFSAIHYDEKIHPNAEDFNPDRFYNEETKTQAKANFYGFGDGPRMCLGMRYGSLVVKLGTAITISKFDVTLNENHKERPKNVSPSFIFAPSFEPILDFYKRGTIYQ